MKKILIADDEKDTLVFLQRGLNKHGFEVACAYDGLQAKAILEKENFDLIILDLVMPNMGGWQVLEWLRNEKKITAPVI
ncbi:MAG: response regulator, partial [Candidatus Omnitrophica bacterium]|nr:response regulator [Candidatus Omnitrophota bacterium]